MIVIVHTGIASVLNGAIGPLTFFVKLADLLGGDVYYGQYYGDDSVRVEVEDWPVVEQLLVENYMLYKVQDVHRTWQNTSVEQT